MTELAKAPSPFFADTTLQYAWDSTSLGYLMECPRKYQLTMIQGWRKKDSSVHLIFGGHFASAMEHFYKFRATGADHDEAVDMVVSEALVATVDWSPDDTKKNRETLIRTIVWYFEEYRNDQAKTITLSNGAPAVELSFKFEADIGSPFANQPYLLTGHLDRLVDFGGDTFVMDQKTTGGSLGPYYFSQYDLDNQMSQYTFAGRAVFNIPVQGVIIDAAQIMVGFTAFGRSITMRSNGQLEEWHANVESWLRLAEHFAETGNYPMNLKSCGNYGGCVFKGICGKDPSVRQIFLESDFEHRYWNPLEIR